MTAPHMGSKVLVRDAFDRHLEQRATSGVVMGKDFEIVWVCSEEEWVTAQREGREPDAVPWPAEDVEVAESAETA